jgi:hypothetical protein
MQAMKDDVAAAHEVQAQQARFDPTCRLFPPFDFAGPRMPSFASRAPCA